MKTKLFVAVTVLAFGLLALAQMMAKPEVRYAMLSGEGGISGTAVILTMPSGEHEVFLRVQGLKPGSSMYANHIHYNDAGDANCKAQNGNKIVGLASLTPDANGNAVAVTKLGKEVKYPAGKTYVNVHSNTPQAVGPSITCGDVEMK